MMQLIIAGAVALALIGSIWKYGDTMADKRETEVRAEYAQKAESERLAKEAGEKALREWALQLSRNYLKFGTSQETFFKGVGDGIAKQIANNPALRRVCMDAVSVSSFNADSAKPGGGTGATSGPGNDGVRKGNTATDR